MSIQPASIRASARDHLLGVVTVATLLSLGLIFGAVLGVLPTDRLPHNPTVLGVIPHANAVISLVAIPTIGLGWRAIRRNEIEQHRLFMLLAGALFGLFLVLYLYRVAVEGPTEYEGAYQFVYVPVLAVHVALAVICIPLLYYVVAVTATHTRAEIPSTRHAEVGRIAASLWIISFALGVVVYLLLYLPH